MSIESSVIGFLGYRLGLRVSGEVPPGPPERYLVVERTGGAEQGDGLERATFAVRSVAPTLSEAVQLSAQVRAAMKRLPELSCVMGCECTREYNFSDVRSKERRYQAVFDIWYLED